MAIRTWEGKAICKRQRSRTSGFQLLLGRDLRRRHPSKHWSVLKASRSPRTSAETLFRGAQRLLSPARRADLATAAEAATVQMTVKVSRTSSDRDHPVSEHPHPLQTVRSAAEDGERTMAAECDNDLLIVDQESASSGIATRRSSVQRVLVGNPASSLRAAVPNPTLR